MHNIFKGLILQAKDIGMQRDTIKEVAEKMKPQNGDYDSSLKDFGLLISEIFDSDKPSLTSHSNGRKNNAAE